jgi:hypothetical protein
LARSNSIAFSLISLTFNISCEWTCWTDLVCMLMGALFVSFILTNFLKFTYICWENLSKEKCGLSVCFVPKGKLINISTWFPRLSIWWILTSWCQNIVWESDWREVGFICPKETERFLMHCTLLSKLKVLHIVIYYSKYLFNSSM